MKCPRCAVDMSPATFHDITIDRCGQCGGILLDKGEAEAIDELGIGGAIEGGAQPAGDAPTTAAHCHACDKPMTELTGAGDIAFDWCDGCERIFFDRGELSAFDATEGE